MSQRIDPDLKKDLLQFGVKDWNDCFHCGNCTAICPLTEDGSLFPRQAIRQTQMGLRKSLGSNLDPWMCYYCGECSDTCPRDANPGELMMSLRRYLTSMYDWTGLSRKFYTSKVWEFSILALIFLGVIALFAIFLPPSSELVSNPARFINEDGGVKINSMVDGMSSSQFLRYIEYGDWTMAILVSFFLITNIIRMFYMVIVRDKSVHVPLYAYVTESWRLIWNFATQAKFSKCHDKKYWIGHLMLMSGYCIMFIVIVYLLPRFQIEEVVPWYNWQRLLGYYATFGILYFLVSSYIGRMKKKDAKLKFSHPSDYLFIVMLGLTTISGILVHIFRISGLPAATYYTYVLHIAILMPMIIVEVPFSKWSHLAYRPIADYFAALKKAGSRKKVTNPAPAFAA